MVQFQSLNLAHLAWWIWHKVTEVLSESGIYPSFINLNRFSDISLSDKNSVARSNVSFLKTTLHYKYDRINNVCLILADLQSNYRQGQIVIENLVRILKTNLTSFSYRKRPSRPDLSNIDRYLSHWCWCVFSKKRLTFWELFELQNRKVARLYIHIT